MNETQRSADSDTGYRTLGVSQPTDTLVNRSHQYTDIDVSIRMLPRPLIYCTHVDLTLNPIGYCLMGPVKLLTITPSCQLYHLRDACVETYIQHRWVSL